MGYQELLIKSDKLSLEKISEIINKKSNTRLLESTNTVATIKNNFNSDKMIIFGKEISMEPVNFSAGEQFLVVAGERSSLDSIHKMFPRSIRKDVEIYPMEKVMQSPQNIDKKYEDVFSDSKLVIHKKSIVETLNSYKEKSMQSRDNIPRHEQYRNNGAR